MNWILAISYWIHLLTTVVWLGGLAVMSLVAFPAWFQKTLADNQWIALQRRLMPYITVSMILLWVTGFYQMTNDAHYTGFLSVDSTWAWAILIKHVAALGMTALSLYAQFRVLPAFARVELLQSSKPKLAGEEMAALQHQENRLLRVNLICAVFVLLCTAVATAV